MFEVRLYYLYQNHPQYFLHLMHNRQKGQQKAAEFPLIYIRWGLYTQSLLLRTDFEYSNQSLKCLLQNLYLLTVLDRLLAKIIREGRYTWYEFLDIK